MTRRSLAIALAVTLFAGCSATAEPMSTPAATTSAQASAAPAPTGAATTSEPSPAPSEPPTAAPTEAPVADAQLELVQTYLYTYDSDFGGGGAQIIAQVTNSGGAVAKVEDGDFTLYAKDESVLDTGTLSAYPQFLPPGETGYLVAFVVFDTDAERKAAGRAEPDAEFTTVDEVPATARLKTAKVKVSKGSFGVWAAVSGTVTNTSDTDLSFGRLGAILLDAKGKPLGWVDDSLTIMDLRAGQTKGFKTESGFVPAAVVKKVKSVVVFAFDYALF